jgi:antitoxin component of MazEF toxin-antitoxin module
MADNVTSTLTKWGNSQGFIIPKSICKAARFHIGDDAEIQVDDCGRIVLAHKNTPRFARRRVVSLEEFVADWQGGKIGEEWSGSDLGEELIQ